MRLLIPAPLLLLPIDLLTEEVRGTECGNISDLLGHIDSYDVAYTPSPSLKRQCAIVIVPLATP